MNVSDQTGNSAPASSPGAARTPPPPFCPRCGASSSRNSEAPKRGALVPRHTQALRAEVRAGRPCTAHPNASFCSQSCCSRGEVARCRWDGSFCRLGGSIFPASALRAPQRAPERGLRMPSVGRSPRCWAARPNVLRMRITFASYKHHILFHIIFIKLFYLYY